MESVVGSAGNIFLAEGIPAMKQRKRKTFFLTIEELILYTSNKNITTWQVRA